MIISVTNATRKLGKLIKIFEWNVGFASNVKIITQSFDNQAIFVCRQNEIDGNETYILLKVGIASNETCDTHDFFSSNFYFARTNHFGMKHLFQSCHDFEVFCFLN